MNPSFQWSERATWRVAAIGECMIEQTDASEPAEVKFGGDTSNFAVYLARMDLENATVDYVTALGNDPFSSEMLRCFDHEGIGTERIRIIKDREPGRYCIDTDNEGERRFEYFRSESAARHLFSDAYEKILTEELMGFDLMYCTGISLAILSPEHRLILIELLESLKDTGTVIAIDTNYRPLLWKNSRDVKPILQRLQSLADVALVTFGDEHAIFNDADPKATLTRIAQAGVGEIVVKNGALPTLAFCALAGHVLETPSLIPENIVDTTAAGDSFNAAYIAGRINGLDQKTAVRVAREVATRVIGGRGAIIPRRDTPSLREMT